MTRTKEYWYVLVMSNDGPMFVTSVNGNNVYWHFDSLPKAFSKQFAKEIANGLTMNGNNAYAVCLDYKKETQPYNYEDYKIEFVRRESEGR